MFLGILYDVTERRHGVKEIDILSKGYPDDRPWVVRELFTIYRDDRGVVGSGSGAPDIRRPRGESLGQGPGEESGRETEAPVPLDRPTNREGPGRGSDWSAGGGDVSDGTVRGRTDPSVGVVGDYPRGPVMTTTGRHTLPGVRFRGRPGGETEDRRKEDLTSLSRTKVTGPIETEGSKRRSKEVLRDRRGTEGRETKRQSQSKRHGDRGRQRGRVTDRRL